MMNQNHFKKIFFTSIIAVMVLFMGGANVQAVSGTLATPFVSDQDGTCASHTGDISTSATEDLASYVTFPWIGGNAQWDDYIGYSINVTGGASVTLVNKTAGTVGGCSTEGSVGFGDLGRNYAFPFDWGDADTFTFHIVAYQGRSANSQGNGFWGQVAYGYTRIVCDTGQFVLGGACVNVSGTIGVGAGGSGTSNPVLTCATAPCNPEVHWHTTYTTTNGRLLRDGSVISGESSGSIVDSSANFQADSSHTYALQVQDGHGAWITTAEAHVTVPAQPVTPVVTTPTARLSVSTSTMSLSSSTSSGTATISNISATNGGTFTTDATYVSGNLGQNNIFIQLSNQSISSSTPVSVTVINPPTAPGTYTATIQVSATGDIVGGVRTLVSDSSQPITVTYTVGTPGVPQASLTCSGHLGASNVPCNNIPQGGSATVSWSAIPADRVTYNGCTSNSSPVSATGSGPIHLNNDLATTNYPFTFRCNTKVDGVDSTPVSASLTVTYRGPDAVGAPACASPLLAEYSSASLLPSSLCSVGNVSYFSAPSSGVGTYNWTCIAPVAGGETGYANCTTTVTPAPTSNLTCTAPTERHNNPPNSPVTLTVSGGGGNGTYDWYSPVNGISTLSTNNHTSSFTVYNSTIGNKTIYVSSANQQCQFIVYWETPVVQPPPPGFTGIDLHIHDYWDIPSFSIDYNPALDYNNDGKLSYADTRMTCPTGKDCSLTTSAYLAKLQQPVNIPKGYIDGTYASNTEVGSTVTAVSSNIVQYYRTSGVNRTCRDPFLSDSLITNPDCYNVAVQATAALVSGSSVANIVPNNITQYLYKYQYDTGCEMYTNLSGGTLYYNYPEQERCPSTIVYELDADCDSGGSPSQETCYNNTDCNDFSTTEERDNCRDNNGRIAYTRDRPFKYERYNNSCSFDSHELEAPHGGTAHSICPAPSTVTLPVGSYYVQHGGNVEGAPGSGWGASASSTPTGEELRLNVVDPTTQPGPFTLATPITSCSADSPSGNTSTQVALSWQPSVGALGYDVFQIYNGNAAILQKLNSSTLPPTTTTFNASSTAGNNDSYYIVANNGGATVRRSNTVSKVIPYCYGMLNVQATLNDAPWSDSAGGLGYLFKKYQGGVLKETYVPSSASRRIPQSFNNKLSGQWILEIDPAYGRRGPLIQTEDSFYYATLASTTPNASQNLPGNVPERPSITYTLNFYDNEHLPPTPGSCGATHYSCNTGGSFNNVEGSTSFTWGCHGINGGADASPSCSEAKTIDSAGNCLNGATNPPTCTRKKPIFIER